MSRDFLLDEPPRRVGPGPAASTPPPGPSAEGLGWLGRLGYALSGALLLAAMLASFNPSFGFFQEERFDAKRWPWELFQGPDGPVLRWLPPHTFLLGMTLSGFALILCAFLGSARVRAGLALTAFVLVAGMFVAQPGDWLMVTGGGVALALLAAGASAARGRAGAGAARLLMGIGWLAMVAFVLLPRPSTGGEEGDLGAATRYRSPAVTTLTALADVLGDVPRPIQQRDGSVRNMTLWDWMRMTQFTTPLLLGLVVGLLALLGLGGRWAAVVIGLLLLVYVLGPCVDRAAHELEEARARAEGGLSSADAVASVARYATEAFLALLRAALLPLALGLADLLRRPRAA